MTFFISREYMASEGPPKAIFIGNVIGQGCSDKYGISAHDGASVFVRSVEYYQHVRYQELRVTVNMML